MNCGHYRKQHEVSGGHHARHYDIAGCVMKMKRVAFWVIVVVVAFFILGQLMFIAVVNHVHVVRDIANNFTLKKTEYKIPVLTGSLLPVQCSAGAGLGRRGQWVCANDYYGSAGATLEQKDVWGKAVDKNPCAFFRAHLQLLEQTEFSSPEDWKSFKIGLAACETV